MSSGSAAGCEEEWLQGQSCDQDGAGPGGDHQPCAAVSAGLQQEHFCCMFMKPLGDQ